MRDYPYIYRVSMQAYYETEPEIKKAIQEKVSDTIKVSTQVIFETIDKSLFRLDIDLSMMYKEIVFAVDGYMLNMYRTGPINADKIENEIDESNQVLGKSLHATIGDNYGSQKIYYRKRNNSLLGQYLHT